MPDLQTLWDDFLVADSQFKAGLIPLHDRQKAFILFKSEFIKEEK